MKILLTLLLIVCLPLTALAEPNMVPASSRIESVTVFADRAQISRTATVSLKNGANLVTFQDLPRSLAEESLRVEGEGTGRSRISGITVKNLFLERSHEKRIHDLEEEIAATTRKLESIEARAKALVAQRNFIESIRVGWSERISKELALGKPTVADLGDAAKFVGEGIGKIEEQLYDAEAAKKPLRDRIAALKKELEQARQERSKEVRSVQVAVDTDRDSRFKLTLSYLVSYAGWEPTYDVTLLPDGKQAELAYRAQVWQKSGEDWSGVKLALSTAAPEVGGGPPELLPWHVSLWEPPRPIPYAVPAAPMAKGVLGARSDEAAAEDMERAVPVTAAVSEGQTSFLFTAPQPVDVPSDGTRAGTVISMQKVPVSAEYITVPKLSQRVYLKSEVVNATPYPLLAGEANVFNGTVFTGKTRLKTISSGEKFDLYFGADDQVKVKRTANRISKGAGILGGNKVSYRIVVELENFKKRAIKLSLLDQLPLPQNTEIKVNLEDADPKPDEKREDGTLVWKMDLAPSQKKRISYDINIEYPKERRLSGAD
jgi:uncharacterized protein (TIGR02231 family)